MPSETAELAQNQSACPPTAEQMSEKDRGMVFEQAKVLSNRARSFRLYAAFVLWLSILAIISAIFVFIQAGKLTGSDLADVVLARDQEIAEQRFLLLDGIDSIRK